MFIRDEMTVYELANWRYADTSEDYADWHFNHGNCADSIKLFLFGA